MRRILVVDDDPHICLAVRAWLKRYGFKVAIADGGTSGLLALDNSTFDLMIVDIFMPHMRGFESIRVFHNRAPTVPLIAISGYAFSSLEAASPDFLRMAIKLGATRCLRKPFRPTTLLSVIDESWRKPSRIVNMSPLSPPLPARCPNSRANQNRLASHGRKSFQAE